MATGIYSDPIGDAFEEIEQYNQAFYQFKGRPNQPDKYDEQEAFIESRTTGVKWLIGGNGAGTTECAVNAAARFMLQYQEPPRPDTPFWIISDTYESCIETAWKEKMEGHGHIPAGEVDWQRIRWYDSKKGLPIQVPLKPWDDRSRNSWMIEFKSYEQGRQKMQARSIGGFLFIEQFPYDLLTEVLRGCREYNFGGGKICEFTPVDPYLSAPIEEMIENDTLPSTWEIYRANTQCAVDAGHVTPEWFEEFYGMVPDEMLQTRMIGAWASYEGLIYQGYNPAVHLAGYEKIDPTIDSIYHRRAIDWGFGPENAFVCLWAFRNSWGQWHVYDEYWSTDQNKTVHEHLIEIAERWEWPQNSPYYGTTWADPANIDAIRIASTFSTYHPEYDNFNIGAAANSVLEGIDCVRYHLKTIPGLGEPRLFIHRDNCPNLRREMKTYRWLQSPAKGLNPKDARSEPLKKDDHAVDSLRYLIFSEFKLGRDGTAKTTRRKTTSARNHGVHLNREGSRAVKTVGERGKRFRHRKN